MNSEFDELVRVFNDLGIYYSEETVHEFYVNWYRFPKECAGFPMISAAGAQFVFDHDGKFVGVGTGDEQPSYDPRERSQI